MSSKPFRFLRLFILITTALFATVFGYHSPKQFASTGLLEVMHLSLTCLPVIASAGSLIESPIWMNYLLMQITNPLVMNLILIGSSSLFLINLICFAISNHTLDTKDIIGFMLNATIGIASIYYMQNPVATLILSSAVLIFSLPPFRQCNGWFGFSFGVCYVLTNSNELISFISPSLLLLNVSIPLIINICFISASVCIIFAISGSDDWRNKQFLHSIIFPIVYGFAAIYFNLTIVQMIINFSLISFGLKQLGYWLLDKKHLWIAFLEMLCFVGLQFGAYSFYVMFNLNIIQLYLLIILFEILLSIITGECVRICDGNTNDLKDFEDSHWSRFNLC